LSEYNFYSVIIGTELLNGRRVDKHFDFLNHQLIKRGWKQSANFVIGDNPTLIENIYSLIKSDKNSVMFSFGGIGATPDDLTRKCAANAFRDGIMETHEEAKRRIIKQFGDDAYPHRINMANLPLNAGLLKNVVNNVPGFSIDERFFFTPGFVKMSQPMVIEALDRYYFDNKKTYSDSFIVNSSENEILDIMLELPSDLEFSSLPKFIGESRIVEIYISDYDKDRLDRWIGYFKHSVTEKGISITPFTPPL
jgi:molybdopterin-biosynthesis enzyme MoeA-like protein